jgi:transcriptional regulator with XRE-family HTH domain
MISKAGAGQTSITGDNEARSLKGVKNMSVGKEIKKLRKQRGLTIREVVKSSEGSLDKTTISRIERDERGLSFKAAYCFSKIYGIRMETLYELVNRKKISPASIPFDTSPQERDFLEIFRTLSIRRRRMITDIVKAVALLGDASAAENSRLQLLRELDEKK